MKLKTPSRKVPAKPPGCSACGAAVEGGYHGKAYCGGCLVQAIQGRLP